MALHDIKEKPLVYFSGTLLQKNTDALLSINFHQTTFSENAVKLTKPSQRGCFTNKEAQLNFLRSTLDYKYYEL